MNNMSTYVWHIRAIEANRQRECGEKAVQGAWWEKYVDWSQINPDTSKP